MVHQNLLQCICNIQTNKFQRHNTRNKKNIYERKLSEKRPDPITNLAYFLLLYCDLITRPNIWSFVIFFELPDLNTLLIPLVTSGEFKVAYLYSLPKQKGMGTFYREK